MAGAIKVVPISISKQVNVAAGATVGIDFQEPSLPGYTTVLFFYSGAGTSNLVPVSVISSYFYSATRTVTLRNVTSSTYSASPTFSAFVLMVKTGMSGGLGT